MQDQKRHFFQSIYVVPVNLFSQTTQYNSKMSSNNQSRKQQKYAMSVFVTLILLLLSWSVSLQSLNHAVLLDEEASASGSQAHRSMQTFTKRNWKPKSLHQRLQESTPHISSSASNLAVLDPQRYQSQEICFDDGNLYKRPKNWPSSKKLFHISKWRADKTDDPSEQDVFDVTALRKIHESGLFDEVMAYSPQPVQYDHNEPFQKRKMKARSKAWILSDVLFNMDIANDGDFLVYVEGNNPLTLKDHLNYTAYVLDEMIRTSANAAVFLAPKLPISDVLQDNAIYEQFCPERRASSVKVDHRPLYQSGVVFLKIDDSTRAMIRELKGLLRESATLSIRRHEQVLFSLALMCQTDNSPRTINNPCPTAPRSNHFLHLYKLENSERSSDQNKSTTTGTTFASLGPKCWSKQMREVDPSKSRIVYVSASIDETADQTAQRKVFYGDVRREDAVLYAGVPMSLTNDPTWMLHSSTVRARNEDRFGFWKAPLLYSLLEDTRMIHDGDFVVYRHWQHEQDANRRAMAQVPYIVDEMLNEDRNFAFVSDKQPYQSPWLRNVTKRDVYEAYCHTNVNSDWRHFDHMDMIIFRKTPAIASLIREWKNAVANWHAVSDQGASPSYLPNYSFFDEHLGDQTLLNLILKCRYQEPLRAALLSESTSGCNSSNTAAYVMNIPTIPPTRIDSIRERTSNAFEVQKKTRKSLLPSKPRSILTGFKTTS